MRCMQQDSLKRRKNLLDLRMQRSPSLAGLPCRPSTLQYVQTLTLALPSGHFAESSKNVHPRSGKGGTVIFSFYPATRTSSRRLFLLPDLGEFIYNLEVYLTEKAVKLIYCSIRRKEPNTALLSVIVIGHCIAIPRSRRTLPGSP